MNTRDEVDIPETVTVCELRANLRRILETVHYFRWRYVILRNGDPIAVLVALEDFRRLAGAPGAPGEGDRR